MPQSKVDFAKKYYPSIVQLTKGTGLFPQVMLGQMILESSGKFTDGKYYPGYSTLARKYNNFFGIKAGSSWKGETVNMKTGEVFNGTPTSVDALFRVYNSPEDSMLDRIKFLQGNARYKKAGVFTATTAQEQAQRLKDAGYATDPDYPQKIMQVFNSVATYLDVAIEQVKKNSNLLILAIVGLFFLLDD